jgi:hypothetical protein
MTTTHLGSLLLIGAVVITAWAAVVLIAGRALLARVSRHRPVPRHRPASPDPALHQRRTRADFTLRS